MNFKIKTRFSNSEYLSTEGDIACFKKKNSSNNQMWNFNVIDEDNGIYSIKNLENNKYLYFDGINRIVKVKEFDISKKEEFYWTLDMMGLSIFVIKSIKQKDFIWDIYTSNNSVLDQPLMVSQSIEALYNENNFFCFEGAE